MVLKLHLTRLIKTTVFLLFILQPSCIYSQCCELYLSQDSLIKELRVKTKEAYLSDIIDNQISNYSNLAYETRHNELGKITEFHSYDTTGTYPIVEYKYTWDNKLLEMVNRYTNYPKNNYTIKNEFDYKGKKACQRFIQNNKTKFKTDFSYDKKGRLKEKTVQKLGKIASKAKKNKYFYDRENRLIRHTATGYTYIANEMIYDDKGKHTHTYRIDRNGNQIPYLEKEYNAQNQLVKAINYGPGLLLYAKKERNNKSDKEEIMIVTYTYSENGLLKTQKVLRNGKLFYFWEFDYVFYEEQN